jgi:hypothetical protein
MNIMTNQKNLVQSVVGDTGNAGQPFDFAAAAIEVNKALDTIAAIMPKFLAAQENSGEFVRRRRNVPVPLVEKVIATAEQHPMLHPAFEVADARAALEFQRLFRPVQARMKAAERELGFSLDARWMEMGRMALQFYAVAKSVIAHTPNEEGLASQVEGMKASVHQAKRQLSPEKAAALEARKAQRSEEKAVKDAAKAAAKAAKVPGAKTKPAAATPDVNPGPM